MDMQTVGKTFLQTRIFNAEQTKKGLSGPDWAEFFAGFLKAAQAAVHSNSGKIVRLTSDGFFAVFDECNHGVQAAIDLQEGSKSVHGHPNFAIGVATGQVYEVPLNGNDHVDYVGSAVDIASYFAIRAKGNAILLYLPSLEQKDQLAVHSLAGKESKRPRSAYFVEHSAVKLPAITLPLPCLSVYWQAQPTNYLSAHPIEDEIVVVQESDIDRLEDKIYFGRVSAFKKERGFGFIQYYTEDQEYKEIYFHMTYVINQTSVQEHDHVQFTVKPGKEDRPQACSVLVMGSRLQGQLESQEPDGSGYITIHNQDSGLIRFFVLPHELESSQINVNDVVEFTVSSGSEMEGLTALNIQPCQGDEEISEVVGSGDNLQIGSIERAVVTVYFVEKGYGFAKCRRNNVYVHVSELNTPANVPSPGDIIEFEVFPGRDGTYRANNIRLVMKKGLTL